MSYLGIALVCLAVVPGSFADDDILKYMSPEEVQQVFHTDHDSVPKYDLVQIHWPEGLHKRSNPERRKMDIRAFGKNISLWLHPRDSVLADSKTPVYYAKYSPDKPQGVEFTDWSALMSRMAVRIFEDPDKLASLVIGAQKSGRITVSGYIDSQNLAVRPLPLRVAEEYSRRHRFVNDTDDFDLSYHVVFDTTDKNTEQPRVLPVNETVLRQIASQHFSITPSTLYVEVLVIVEYSMYRMYKPYLYSLLQYLLAFWNGVDLKYRSLTSPEVRFRIASIIIAGDYNATPYISNNSVAYEVFNCDNALIDAGKFYSDVRDSFPLNSYDISVTLTRQSFGFGEDSATLGIAWVGTACTYYDPQNKTSNVALVNDNGAFKGVSVAAHEVGHLLGASHDTSGKCVEENGFIMTSILSNTKNSSDFSTCSIESFNEQLRAFGTPLIFASIFFAWMGTVVRLSIFLPLMVRVAKMAVRFVCTCNASVCETSS